MSRFEKVAKLADACFKERLGPWSYIHVNKRDNYIALVENYKMGDILTEVFYNPREKTAEILTFDENHIEESCFSRLLDKIGIKSTVEICEYPENSEYTFPLPLSPSGRSKLIDDILDEAFKPIDSEE